jgi:hypothetical protein
VQGALFLAVLSVIEENAFGNLSELCRAFMAGKAHLDCLCKTAVFEGF